MAPDADRVRELASTAADLPEVVARTSVCRACPRLVDWRERVAREPRRAFAGQPYWGRPVPGWGSEAPRILVVGLAPAAHGGNRTGRIFTGDRSGDWLFAALHRCGLAERETSVYAGDGQRLRATRVVAAVRCAPPANKPTPTERDTCQPWLAREVELCAASVRAVVALGAYAWDSALRVLPLSGYGVPRPKPRFGHGRQVELVRSTAGRDASRLVLLAALHPSQQNTFTGKLTHGMLEDVFARAKEFAGLG